MLLCVVVVWCVWCVVVVRCFGLFRLALFRSVFVFCCGALHFVFMGACCCSVVVCVFVMLRCVFCVCDVCCVVLFWCV